MFTIYHYHNKRLITRIECEHDNEAIGIANEIVSDSISNGFHQVIVVDDKNDDIFNEAYIIEDAHFARPSRVKVGGAAV